MEQSYCERDRGGGLSLSQPDMWRDFTAGLIARNHMIIQRRWIGRAAPCNRVLSILHGTCVLSTGTCIEVIGYATALTRPASLGESVWISKCCASTPISTVATATSSCGVTALLIGTSTEQTLQLGYLHVDERPMKARTGSLPLQKLRLFSSK